MLNRKKTTIVRDKLKIGVSSSETLDFAAFDFKNEKQGVLFLSVKISE
jgi:hypothetical protein